MIRHFRCERLKDARIAQLVEQRIENPRVAGSNPDPRLGRDHERDASYLLDKPE
jgi:beta-xylosidase